MELTVGRAALTAACISKAPFAALTYMVSIPVRETLSPFLKESVKKAKGMSSLNLMQEVVEKTSVVRRLVHELQPEDPLPALAIRREIQALEQARVNAARDVEIAREDAEAILIDVAGPQWATVNNAISAWQEADRFGGDVSAKQMAADVALEADDVSGQVASSLQMARAYASLVEVTLGQEARRHEGLLPAWREQRGLVASRMWSEVFANVMSTQDVEVVQVPEFGDFQLRLAGSDDVQELRRRMRLNEREAAQMIDGIDLDNPWLMGASMMQLQGPGRQLQRDSSSLNNPG